LKFFEALLSYIYVKTIKQNISCLIGKYSPLSLKTGYSLAITVVFPSLMPGNIFFRDSPDVAGFLLEF